MSHRNLLINQRSKDLTLNQSFCLIYQICDLVLSSDKILTVGDFSIHEDTKNDSLNKAFILFLDLIGLSQNVILSFK